MTLPDPNEGRATPHAGHRWVWTEELTYGRYGWRTVPRDESKQCRWREDGIRCPAASVAKMLRGSPDHVGRRSTANDWWHYCGDHLFGRVIDAGRVYSARLVPLEDPAAGVDR